jgi:dTDP-4-dehydrorhamnose 3,5-epimerase-like enzyme
MNSHVKIEVLPLRTDARGYVVEPLHPDALAAQRNVHVVFTEPGGVRGNHYHQRGTEIVTVIGPAMVRTKNRTDVHDTIVPEQQAYRFTIPPGISHAILNTGNRATLLIAFNTEIHDPEQPDLVRDVILTG